MNSGNVTNAGFRSKSLGAPRPRTARRTVIEVDAEEVGASLKYAKAERTRSVTPTPDAEQGESPAAAEGDALF